MKNNFAVLEKITYCDGSRHSKNESCSDTTKFIIASFVLCSYMKEQLNIHECAIAPSCRSKEDNVVCFPIKNFSFSTIK